MGIAMLAAVRMVRAMPHWLDAIAPKMADRLAGGRRHRHLRAVDAAAKPTPALRVLRVFEPHQSRAAAGRMVISGRMADVCAELDRLAAAEATQAPH